MPNSEVFSYPQDDMDHSENGTSTSLNIYHAPFSLLHVQGEKTPGSIPISFLNDKNYYIPQTTEFDKTETDEELERNISLLPNSGMERIKSEYLALPKRSIFFGEYLPQTYSKSPEKVNGNSIPAGYTLDPLKFITNLLVKRHLELPHKNQEIVLHPDILYFASGGRIENLPIVLKYLNSVTEILGQKLFFENMAFSNPKYKEALGALEDPIQILAMVKQYPQLGVVIDIEHLEKTHRPVEVIRGITPQRLIVHARQGYNERYQELYYHCVKQGIPWIVE
jgi:hypothetical protein